jgi:hypothetical protein
MASGIQTGFLTCLPHASDHDQQEPTSGFGSGIIRNIALTLVPALMPLCMVVSLNLSDSLVLYAIN